MSTIHTGMEMLVQELREKVELQTNQINLLVQVCEHLRHAIEGIEPRELGGNFSEPISQAFEKTSQLEFLCGKMFK